MTLDIIFLIWMTSEIICTLDGDLPESSVFLLSLSIAPIERIYLQVFIEIKNVDKCSLQNFKTVEIKIKILN